VQDLLESEVAVEIMKELQEVMETQRKMAVGNAEAEELLAKLVYNFADVTRAVEAMVSIIRVESEKAVRNGMVNVMRGKEMGESIFSM